MVSVSAWGANPGMRSFLHLTCTEFSGIPQAKREITDEDIGLKTQGRKGIHEEIQAQAIAQSERVRHTFGSEKV